METQIISFIKNNQNICLPIIFFITFIILILIGFKQLRSHYKDNNKLFIKSFKEGLQYHFLTSFIDWHYHVIPYIYIIEDLDKLDKTINLADITIEDFSINLYSKFSNASRSNYLFFVIAKKQRLIRINLGEDIKFLLSLKEAEELLDKLIENVEFNNFIVIWKEVKQLCKKRFKKLNIRSIGLNVIPFTFSYVARGLNPKAIDKNGNLDTFNSNNLYEKCIGITKTY